MFISVMMGFDQGGKRNWCGFTKEKLCGSVLPT